MRTIKISALNIAMHAPHSPAGYVDLFRAAFRAKRSVSLGKLHRVMLGSFFTDGPKDRNDVPKEVHGEIYRFVHIDPEQPWFNSETGTPATEEDMVQIAIPDHLLPHLQRLAYVFRPHAHELLYVSQDRGDRLGPQSAVTFFQRLFDDIVLRKKLPDVEVTAIVERNAIDELFAVKGLEKITIDLKRPNPDDLGGEAEKWLKKLEKQKARSARTELIAEKGQTLEPDAETRSIARVAANNGKVTVTGRDAEGLRVEESTVARPLTLTERVDEKLETATNVLQRTTID